MYHQLGMVAQAQRQWPAAARYGLEAAEIFVQYQDQHSLGVVLRSLARTWRETGEAQIPRIIGQLLEISVEEAEARLNELIEPEAE